MFITRKFVQKYISINIIFILIFTSVVSAQNINEFSDVKSFEKKSKVFLQKNKYAPKIKDDVLLNDIDFQRKKISNLLNNASVFNEKKVVLQKANITLADKENKIINNRAVYSKTVSVTSGGLSQALTAYEKGITSNLTINGTIDARDFVIMRDSMPCLTDINISNSTITEYIGENGTDTVGKIKTYIANKIPQYAFWNPITHITLVRNSIQLPSSITEIGDFSFLGQSSLLSFTIPPSVIIIGKEAFSQTSFFTTLVIPNSVKTIKDYAFVGSSLINITVPSTVDTIGKYAFKNNLKLTTAKISAKNIGMCAFDSCLLLNNLTINNTVTHLNAWSFENCLALTSVTIPNSVKDVGYWAFQKCDNLTTVSIDADTIESSAFENLDKLSTLTLNKNVKYIGMWAFASCDALKTVGIPGGVKRSFFAFSNCKGLTTANIWVNYWIDTCTFTDDINLKTVNIYNPCQYIFTSAFENCTSLETISTTYYLYGIYDYAFFNCFKLKAFDVPGRLTSIGTASFKGTGLVNVSTDNLKYCSANGILYDKNQTMLIHSPNSLTGEFVIPTTVNSLSSYAFSDCIGLDSIKIPETITSIGDDVFLNCTKLSSINIPSKITYLGWGLFADCKNLKSLTIPKSVTSINNFCFYGCESLKSLHVNLINPVDLTGKDSVFVGVNKTDCVLYVPMGSKDVYKNAYLWKDFNNIVEEEIYSGTTQITNETIGVNTLKNAIQIKNIPNDAIVQILTMNGNVIVSKKSNKDFLLISDLVKGIYIVRVGNKTTKVIVN